MTNDKRMATTNSAEICGNIHIRAPIRWFEAGIDAQMYMTIFEHRNI